MMSLLQAARTAALCLLAGSQLPAPAAAEDRLIWQPTRTSDNAMRLRMGVKLPAPGNVSAGADIGVSASRSGRVRETPVDVWARISETRGEKTAVVNSRSIDGRFDPRTGIGQVDISIERTRILTDLLDVRRSRGITVACDSHEKRCTEVVLRQGARLTATATGTALVAEGHYSASTLDFSNVVRLEQSVTDHMNVTAALAAPFQAGRQASVNLSYAFNW